MALLTIILNNSLTVNFASHPNNLELCWFGGLSPQRGNLSPKGNNNGLLKLEDETSTWQLWAPSAVEPTGRKRVTLLAGVIDLSYQGATELLLYNKDKENYDWNIGGFLG